MSLNLDSLICVIKPPQCNFQTITTVDGVEKRIGTAKLNCEATLSRTRSLQLLGKMKDERKQGDWNKIVELLLDLRYTKSIALDLEFQRNSVQVLIGGQEQAYLGSDIKLSRIKLSAFGDEDITWTWQLHGPTSGESVAWLFDNPGEQVELRVKGPGEETAPEQADALS